MAALGSCPNLLEKQAGNHQSLFFLRELAHQPTLDTDCSVSNGKGIYLRDFVHLEIKDKTLLEEGIFAAMENGVIPTQRIDLLFNAQGASNLA